jgi:hypothetical protein
MFCETYISPSLSSPFVTPVRINPCLFVVHLATLSAAHATQRSAGWTSGEWYIYWDMVRSSRVIWGNITTFAWWDWTKPTKDSRWWDDAVLYRPSANRWLCKQQPLLSNARYIQARNNTTRCNPSLGNRYCWKRCFPLDPPQNYITRTQGRLKGSTRVEAGSNTSTVTLRLVGGDEKEVSNLRQ